MGGIGEDNDENITFLNIEATLIFNNIIISTLAIIKCKFLCLLLMVKYELAVCMCDFHVYITRSVYVQYNVDSVWLLSGIL